MTITYKLHNKICELHNCNSQTFGKVLKQNNIFVKCSECKTNYSNIDISKRDNSYLYENGIYNLDKSLCKSCMSKKQNLRDFALIYNNNKTIIYHTNRDRLIDYLIHSDMTCKCGSKNINWKRFIKESNWIGHSIIDGLICYNIDLIQCEECYNKQLKEKQSDIGKYARSHVSNEQSRKNAIKGWKTLKNRPDYQEIADKRTKAIRSSWTKEETREHHKNALNRLNADKQYHKKLSIGQKKRTHKDICLNTLYREWHNKSADAKTDFYYGQFKRSYKIGISKNAYTRHRKYLDDRIKNIQIIRTFKNRYIAAFVEYKIKLQFAHNRCEIISKNCLNKVIDYVKNFKLTNKEIKQELKELGCYSL